MSSEGNILQLLLLVLCVGLVALLEETNDSSSNSTASATMSSAPSSSMVVTVEATTAATTKVVPANTTASVEATTCNANESSCVTASSDTTAVTAATTFKNTSTLTTLKPSSRLKNVTNSTTLKPSTTLATTTAMPQIEKELIEDFNLDVCTCDLQRYFCDINCCCDKDCSFEDKMVFKSCKREANLHRDTSFCQYMDYIYLNNTPYKWEVNQNGLFCIAKSNLPARYAFQRKEPITTFEDAQLQKHNKHSWPELDDKQAQEFKFNTSESFVFGSNIWMLKHHSLELFQLPDNFITNACLIKKNMKFLQNFKTKCSQTYINENNPSLNAENYFKNISVIRAPRFFNTSILKKNFHNCTSKVCLPIEAKICDENYENCINISTNDHIHVSCHLSIASNANSCTNLMQKVKYNFYHNGTGGFTKIELLLILKNISYYFGEENLEFLQQFEVNYLWSNYSFSYSSLKSGNPGYLISKPILIGNIKVLNATNSTKLNKTKNGIKIQRNPSDIADNFLILPANKKGLCVLNNNTHVALEFGYNMMLKCTIKTTLVAENLTGMSLCRNIQKAVFDYWPISKTNLTGVNKVVGNFGNANESVLSDWTEILSNRTPAQILNETNGNFTLQNTTLLCKNIVTRLRIDVFHARVDFKDLRNQEKVLGVSYHFGMGQDFEFELSGGRVTFEAVIREEVMFFDITSERVQKFVDPPTFTITLPYDFFYPFVKVGNKSNSLSACSVIILIALIFLPYIYGY